MKFKDKIDRIRIFGMDVDGVLTDGRFTFIDSDSIKFFNAKDGIGLVLLNMANIKNVIISGKMSLALEKRCCQLPIEYCFQNVKDKCSCMQDVLKKECMEWDEVCYMGDDLPDIPLMRKVGLSIVPADACQETKELADFVCKEIGGRGAVREAVEFILKGQEKWNCTIRKYLESISR